MKGWRARWLLPAVALIAAAGGATVAWRLESQRATAASEAPATASVSSAALFAQTLPDADGVPQPVAQWRGKVLVVNFWATWCAPCVEEMPDLNRVRQEYRARGVEVIGVAIDRAEKVRAFRDQHRLSLPLLVAGTVGSELARSLGNPGGVLPYTALVAPGGEITQRKLGQIKPGELKRWLDAHLGQPAS